MATPREHRAKAVEPDWVRTIYDTLDGVISDPAYLAGDLLGWVEELRDDLGRTLDMLREEQRKEETA